MKDAFSKQELFDAFDGKISKTCIVPDQGEPLGYMILGKYCWIQYGGDDWWNVFIHGGGYPEPSSLGQRKVNRIAHIVSKSALKSEVRILTEEANVWVQGTEAILQNRKLLGIRKKREYSPDERDKRIRYLRGDT